MEDKVIERFNKMKVAGNLAARTLDMITDYITPGISTDFIDLRTCPDYVDSCVYVCNDGTSNPCHPDNLYSIAIDTSGSEESTDGSRYRIYFPW